MIPTFKKKKRGRRGGAGREIADGKAGEGGRGRRYNEDINHGLGLLSALAFPRTFSFG